MPTVTKRPNPPKGFHEQFARFFEEPRRERLRDILKNTGGEYPHLDFKKSWPASPKLARHILALANSGGGCLIIGVEDESQEAVGVEVFLDKTDVLKGIKSFLPQQCFDLVSLHDFPFKDSEYPALVGKAFQVVLVDDDPRNLPYIAVKNGDGIKGNAIYVRSSTSSEEASHGDLQKLLNRRIETGHSSRRELDLQMHLDQLKVLFASISPGISYPKSIEVFIRNQLRDVGEWSFQPNSSYPKEDFGAFVVRMIRAKKIVIERELGVEGVLAVD